MSASMALSSLTTALMWASCSSGVPPSGVFPGNHWRFHEVIVRPCEASLGA